MNKYPFLLKMHKENDGQCREKNEKLCKVERAGTPFIDKTEYYIFHDGLLNILYYHQKEKLENNYKTSF